MRIVPFILFILGSLMTFGQGYEVTPIPSLSGPGVQIPIVVWGDSLLVQTEDSVEFYADIAIANQTKTSLIQTAERGLTWSEFESPIPIVFPGLRGREIAYAYPRPNTDQVYVTMKDGKTGTYGIYRLTKAGKGYGKPVSMGLHDSTKDAIRPSFSADGTQMFYSSNANDGQGGFDIYYINSTKDGWSLPVNVKAVNSAANDIEAVWQSGDLYFSSDRNGNYDLFHAEKRKQWRTPKPLPDPINSESNDMRIAFLVDGRGYFGSDRSGDLDVYEFKQYVSESSGAGYFASLEALGKRVPNTEVEIFNELDERMAVLNTGSDGKIPLREIKMRRTYKIKFPDVKNELLDQSVLYVLNSSNKKIMAFRKGDEDYFLFELLPEDETGELELMVEEDNDLLNVFINGKVVDNEGNRAKEGIPIYMTNDEGEMIAVAYTTSAGEFEFDHLHPNATYRFEVDEENQGVRLIIQDGDKTVELPMTEGSALYERVTKDEALNLYNEKGEPITIRPDDLFVIENIYFGFNEATLNVAAKYQLDQLAKIMVANPNITIELSSHTDSRGDDPYNLELSQQRANNSKAYLMEKGVDKSRMIATGFGETKLLNQCSNGVPCSEADHALNRRTEIRIFIR